MREIVVISGKGGAGKTSITGAFAHLAKETILCDLDVDTPDLHILLAPQKRASHEFWSGHEAKIIPPRCTACGKCIEVCRFDAITQTKGVPQVIALRCEGCKACVVLCPEQAIAFEPKHCGDWFVSDTRFGTMVHAQLFPGEENSGRLVSLLKQEARTLARAQGAGTILADGAPGIGCPVISSLQGATLAVVITEPTPSGRHDFERVAGLCDHFRIKVAVIINKYDLNPQETEAIKSLCRERGYVHAADLPYDTAITKAMVDCKVITEVPDSAFSGHLAAAWETISQLAAHEKKKL